MFVFLLCLLSLWSPAASAGSAAALVSPGAAVVSIDARPRKHAQRSVLRRLAMLRRAAPPARGVDLASAGALFPGWLVDGALDAPAVLPDLVLALSYLAQEEEEEEA